MNNPEYIENNKMTEAGLEQLQKAMPHADFTRFRDDPSVSKMPDLFTVNTIVNYVENKLSAA